MKTAITCKTKKIFPLAIEESLHKALKHNAIELEMSLHAYIIEALVSRVSEESSPYDTGGNKLENLENFKKK